MSSGRSMGTDGRRLGGEYDDYIVERTKRGKRET